MLSRLHPVHLFDEDGRQTGGLKGRSAASNLSISVLPYPNGPADCYECVRALAQSPGLGRHESLGLLVFIGSVHIHCSSEGQCANLSARA